MHFQKLVILPGGGKNQAFVGNLTVPESMQN